MHLSVKTSHALDEAEVAVNPDQMPADLLMLSFTDSDLACMAGAYREFMYAPSLCLTSLARLTHPLSVDLYIEQVAAHAKKIVVRLIGGLEWWRYGAEELARVARANNIELIMVPGDGRADPRLTELSTVGPEIVAAVDQCLAEGGVENAKRVLELLVNGTMPVAARVENGALYREVLPQNAWANATIIFYRAHYLAADVAPIDAMLDALAEENISVRAFMVTSLKDPVALAAVRSDVAANRPDIVIDATAFSAGDGVHPLADIGAPVLQVALANMSKMAWDASMRGLATTDLAMHVVLPEADGRIFTRAISFKAEAEKDARTQFTRNMHQPEEGRIRYVSKLAANWARLAKKPAGEKKLALILSDYPDRAGRSGFAVGLDAPASAVEILRLLAANEYVTGAFPDVLLPALKTTHRYSLDDYSKRFAAMPEAARQALTEAWGAPEEDPFFADGAFDLPAAQFGNVTVALQPDRGSRGDRKSGYHDAVMPPRHGYLAFYWWLQDMANIDALVHLGTHGNLEWLPGKAAGLSAECWPELVLGAVPVMYPYIVSDPGEAAQAKRRISAVTMSHMTPPLMPVALSPELLALETLVDEYSAADGLDARRMKLLKDEILQRARCSGLPGEDDNALMNALEAHLCDIKEQRVGDGLHVFGREAPTECTGLLSALAGRFVMPGPGGSPVRGRLDVLPTGRNMVTLDPRMIPTPTAAIIGKRSAEEFVRRYVQDHGDWPKNVMLDLWGGATLRNGGDEIAQALYLMGVNPRWDDASGRVTGFDVLPDNELPWPRVDVSLRISGLFRDMFAHLIALFDDAVQAVHGDENARLWRIFGSAPFAYGSGVNPLIDSGEWKDRDALGQAYIDASQFAYGRNIDGEAQQAALRERIQSSDALVHVQDQREMDVLSGADFADAEGGFAAAAQLLGGDASLYHIDTSQPGKIKARTLAEEISLTLHARALNAEWIEGQMRHGYAGAASFADVVDQLFAFAATSDTVTHAQFDAVFDAYMNDAKVHDFMARENPEALAAMRARFEEALRRGLWQTLRNSVWTRLERAA